jgi:hypothetical protein
MTPQSHFIVAAPIRPERAAALDRLLASMNDRPGFADPSNALVPFGAFDKLHFARFVVLKDETLGDLAAFGVPVPEYPVRLGFIGECDGPSKKLLQEFASHPAARKGLREIFSHCESFNRDSDLLQWMRGHELKSIATYVNWRGRTVRQVHEEAKLRDALVGYIDEKGATLAEASPREIRAKLMDHIDELLRAGDITVTPPARTPLGWRLKNTFHFLIPFLAAGAVGAVVWYFPFLLLPFLVAAIVFLLVFVVMLRAYEKSEPEVIVRPRRAHAEGLAADEDHDVTNQYSVIGSVKPSWFRLWTMTVLLWATEYGARHIYNQGHLARIRTILFAHWTFVDNKKRIIFFTSYDGNLDAYMEDFINKVGWGLNLLFAPGVAYPRTHWLTHGGSKEEQKFKYTNRRHELPTAVWYKAYPGLTCYDLARNARIRQGYETSLMSDREVLDWLRDL